MRRSRVLAPRGVATYTDKCFVHLTLANGDYGRRQLTLKHSRVQSKVQYLNGASHFGKVAETDAATAAFAVCDPVAVEGRSSATKVRKVTTGSDCDCSPALLPVFKLPRGERRAQPSHPTAWSSRLGADGRHGSRSQARLKWFYIRLLYKVHWDLFSVLVAAIRCSSFLSFCTRLDGPDEPGAGRLDLPRRQHRPLFPKNDSWTIFKEFVLGSSFESSLSRERLVTIDGNERASVCSKRMWRLSLFHWSLTVLLDGLENQAAQGLASD